jgi:hypothetical protein
MKYVTNHFSWYKVLPCQLKSVRFNIFLEYSYFSQSFSLDLFLDSQNVDDLFF